MKKRKFLYGLSAFLMACIISFSGIGGSYIQARASSGIFDVLWNTDESAWSNIAKYLGVFIPSIGAYIEPTLLGELFVAERAVDFIDYMLSDGYTEEEANEIVHGGGGHVREGITADDEGNITYSDEVSDLFYGYVKSYLDSHNGYFSVMSLGPENVDPSWFHCNKCYKNFIDIVKNSKEPYYYCINDAGDNDYIYIRSIDGYLVFDSQNESATTFDYARDLRLYDDNWNIINNNMFVCMDFGIYYETSHTPGVMVDEVTDDNAIECIYLCPDTTADIMDETITEDYYSSKTISDFPCGISSYYQKASGSYGGRNSACTDYIYNFYRVRENSYIGKCIRAVIAPSPMPVKVFKTADAMKNYDVGYQPYYCTNEWNTYNSTEDNSITITKNEFEYYTDNSSVIYQNVQNNIINNNNGSDLTEVDVQRIVDESAEQIKQQIKDLENSSGNDTGDSSGDSGNDSGNDSGGSGVADVIGGIGKLLDTILSLIGNLMGVVADFTQSILDLFSGFTTFTDGFTGFLSGTFAFIPPDIWNLIKVGLSLGILCAVIKFLRN